MSSSLLPSSQQFFNTLELIAPLAGYLDTGEISKLLKSNHLYHCCQPFLFTHLESFPEDNSSGRSINMLGRRDSIPSLAKHVSSVRSVHVKGFDRAYLFNCFLLYRQSLQGTDASSAPSTRPVPVWLSPQNDIPYPVTPLAPMTNLTELFIDVEQSRVIAATLFSKSRSRTVRLSFLKCSG